MPREIQRVQVALVKSYMGYTVELTLLDEHGATEESMSLAGVLDLSWTQAKDLRVLLDKFIKDNLPPIHIPDSLILLEQLNGAKNRLKVYTDQYEKATAKVELLEGLLEEARRKELESKN